MSEYSPPMFLTYTCAIYYIFRYYKTLSVRLICLTGGDRYFVSCISFMVMFRISLMSLSSLLFQHSTDLFVKVGINTLGFIEDIVFAFRLFFCLGGRHLSLVRKNLITAESQEFIDACRELSHIECIFALDKVFNVIEKSCHRTFQLTDFFLIQKLYVRFQNAPVRRVLPRCQSHVLFGMVSLAIHYLCSSLSCDGIMETVLNHGIKVMSCR